MYSITAALVAWLRGAGYAAYARPRKEMPVEFVTVERQGGPVTDMVDHPTVAVQTWAPTEERSEQMALEIRAMARVGPLPEGVSRIDVNAGPYPFYDEGTRCPRHQLVLDVTSRLTN